MNYKDRINGGFAGCRLLAYAHDNCRNRDVRLFLLPESDECVGVADGTDAWIAPTSASLFTVNVSRIIADGRAGKGWPTPVKPEGANRTRRTLLEVEGFVTAHTSARRAIVELPTIDQNPSRSRRNVKF